MESARVLPVLVVATCLSLPSAASPQDVHKCVDNGHVTYQSAPCAHADTVVHLRPAAPTASDAEAAAARAQANKAAMQSASAPAGDAVPSTSGGAAATGESCSALGRQYGDALDNRDLLDRQPFTTSRSPVNNAREDTRRQLDNLEARMRASNCRIARP